MNQRRVAIRKIAPNDESPKLTKKAQDGLRENELTTIAMKQSKAELYCRSLSYSFRSKKSWHIDMV